MCSSSVGPRSARPGGRRRRAGLGGWLLANVLVGVSASAGQAQEMPVPVDRQITLIGKILQFDRAFGQQRPSEVVLAVLHQSGFRASRVTRDAIVEILEPEGSLAGTSVRVVSVELDGDTSPEEALEGSGAHVAYVAPLRAVEVASIARATRALEILSFTGVPEYVEDGLAVGLAVRGERVEILINLRASRLEGARLSSELLKLSRLIDSGDETRE